MLGAGRLSIALLHLTDFVTRNAYGGASKEGKMRLDRAGPARARTAAASVTRPSLGPENVGRGGTVVDVAASAVQLSEQTESGARPKQSSEPAIVVEGLRHRYRGAKTEALRGIDLVIRRGACHGLLGPNGAGKSTLFALLTGVLKLQAGEVTVAGFSARRRLPSIRRLSALAPQDLAFYPKLTVRENLSFFGGVYRLTERVWRERLTSCISICRLEEVVHKRAETLSGGLKRRLNLAIALLNQPQILYLDEPTVGIDALSRAFILKAIADLKAEGVTIVYTSHYMEEVEALCDTITVIDYGRIVVTGSKDEIVRSHARSALRITLAGTPGDAAIRVALGSLPYRWCEGGAIEIDAVDVAAVAAAADRLARAGLEIVRMQYGAARLEQAYLALLAEGES
jgi:ABC-2 type transport system ATP-binding protein